MIAAHLDLLMFAAAIALLLRGYPVAFTLAGTGLIFALLGAALGTGYFSGGDISFLRLLAGRIFGLFDETSEVLAAVPLFIFMGVMLERSRVAADLLETMGRLFGRARGGLGLAVTIVGMLLAASTGIVGATVVTMGLISLPSMLRHNYSKPLACGTIAAAGTLGQIIPPSIVLVILGDTLSNRYIEARRASGDWAPDPVSVGDIFAGAMLPGLGLVGLYILYQIAVAGIRPAASPAMVHRDRATPRQILRALLPPVILIVAVLGSILAGVATPTEAAAVGAVGAILLAGARFGNSAWPPIAGFGGIAGAFLLASALDLRIARPEIGLLDQTAIILAAACCALAALGIAASLWRCYRERDHERDSGGRVLTDVMRSTTRITSMVFTIMIGAQVFNLTFLGLGGEESVRAILGTLPGGPWGALIAVMLVMFILGFFLDFLEIVLVVVPITAPVLFSFSNPDGSAFFHPVWVAVMIGVNLQTSFLTPPFGFALFYLRGVAPPEVSTMDIYRGVIPYVGLQLLMLGILAGFPALATWLPEVVFG